MELYSTVGLNAEGKGYLAAWVHDLPKNTKALAKRVRREVTRRRVIKALKILGFIALSPFVVAYAVYGTTLIIGVMILFPLSLLP